MLAWLFFSLTLIGSSVATGVDTRLQPIFHTPGAGSNGYAGDPNGLMYREDTGLFHFFWQVSEGLLGPRTSLCNCT